MLPDSFFAIDGLLETTLTVLDQMDVYPAVIARENEYYLPFLATTTVLMAAVKAGAGRENAHSAIKEHAIATVRDLRSGTVTTNDLVKRLATDERIGLDETTITEIIDNAHQLTGLAGEQVDRFVNRCRSITEPRCGCEDYKPESIL